MACAGARLARCGLALAGRRIGAFARAAPSRPRRVTAIGGGRLPAGWPMASRPGQGRSAMMPLRLCRSPKSAHSIESSCIFNAMTRRQPCFTPVSGAFPGCFCPVSGPFHEWRAETGAAMALLHRHVPDDPALPYVGGCMYRRLTQSGQRFGSTRETRRARQWPVNETSTGC